MRVLLSLCVVVFAAVSGFGQSADVAAVQKSLKSDLDKNAPAATGIGFDGCKMTMKLTRGEYVTVMKDLTGQRERDLNPMKPQPSTDRPGDEAARNLSSGAGDDYTTFQTDKFTIDFSLMDASGIEAAMQRSGKTVSVGLFPAKGSGAITRKDGDKTIAPASLIFGVKESAAARVVEGMRKIAQHCKQ